MHRYLIFLLTATLLTGCYSTTQIYSEPPGARVIMDGDKELGRTPIELTEMVWVWTSHDLRLERDGYATTTAKLKSKGIQLAPIFACVCTLGLLLPVMFVSKYEPQMLVALDPAEGSAETASVTDAASIDFR